MNAIKNMNFPFKPTENQEKYIKFIEDNLSKTPILLLEAGTGFGKTIANLFSTVQDKSRKHIFYGSRTLLQNSQVMVELENLKGSNPDNDFTGLELASRKNLCHVEEVINAKYQQALILCKYNREKDYPGCSLAKKRSKEGEDSEEDFTIKFPEILSIDTLKNVCNDKSCAYLTALSLAKHRTVVSGSYQYFLNNSIREILDFPMLDCVILDEGHNLEDIICNFYSTVLNFNSFMKADAEMNLLQDAIAITKSSLVKEIQQLELRKRMENKLRQEIQFRIESINDQISYLNKNNEVVKTYRSQFKGFRTSLKKTVEVLDPKGESDGYGIISPFSEQLFLDNNISDSRMKNTIKRITLIEKLLADFKINFPKEQSEEEKERKKKEKEDHKYKKKGTNKKKIITPEDFEPQYEISKVKDFLLTYFEINKNNDYGIIFRNGHKDTQYKNAFNKHKIEIRLLTPAKLFNSLLKHCQSMIICSGTLNPMETFTKIFGIKQHMTASYPAVYKPENIKFLGIGTINNKYPLSTSYKTRKQVGETKLFGVYYKNVILKLINLAPEKAGILIFVPSYQILNQIQLPDVINNTITVYKEPSSKIHYYEDPEKKNEEKKTEDEKTDSWEETLSQYKENIANGFKSVLIGVYRGKIAEGANFSDNDARMIICVGIPYPPFTDPYIKLKRDYYDNMSQGLGEEWYTMQASRAISQAIGRGWRHKDDWCLGILLDNKLSWTSNNIKEKFSLWIKENTTYFHQWNKFQNEILSYYEDHKNP